jgi:hypothetical protein
MAKETRQLIATLEERQSYTGGGAFCLFLLVAFQLLMVMAFFGAAKSAVQEASIGTLWIAGNILLGTGVLAGRKRTYRVMREPPPDAS